MIILTGLHEQKGVSTFTYDSEDYESLQPKNDLDIAPNVDNKVRSFSMYALLERPLMEFLEEGDGLHALPVFEEEYFPDAELIDASLVNLVKFVSTAFGRSKLAQAYKIVDRIHTDQPKMKKRTFRFRSRHPLFTDGSSKYQNICLVSGMVHLGIPILPYFDGEKVLECDSDTDRCLDLLRSDNKDLI